MEEFTFFCENSCIEVKLSEELKEFLEEYRKLLKDEESNTLATRLLEDRNNSEFWYCWEDSDGWDENLIFEWDFSLEVNILELLLWSILFLEFSDL